MGIRAGLRELGDARGQGGLDEEVLAEGLLRPDPVAFGQSPERARREPLVWLDGRFATS
jgi:hypothetical protein